MWDTQSRGTYLWLAKKEGIEEKLETDILWGIIWGSKGYCKDPILHSLQAGGKKKSDAVLDPEAELQGILQGLIWPWDGLIQRQERPGLWSEL